MTEQLKTMSLLQGIFTIQESNQGFLHCRQILYQLSYQGISMRLLNIYLDRENEE